MRNNRSSGDLDWFYNEEKRPAGMGYDPKKKYRTTFREKFMSKHKKQYGAKSIFKSFAFWVMLAIAIAAVCFWYVPKEYEIVDNFDYIAPPTTFRAIGSAQKTVSGKEIQMEYLSQCILRGKVVDVQGYLGFEVANRVSPLDVGICWGRLQQYPYDISFSSPGNRNLYFKYDVSLLKKYGEDVTKDFSNYHLIPSSFDIQRLMSKIQKGDYIKLEGYIVRVTAKTGSSSQVIFSSQNKTTREDFVEGEAFYITSIKWLKKGGDS